MYHKRSFATMPNLGGFFEDVLQNNFPQEFRTSHVPVNIHEDDKDYNLHVVAPGLKKDDFKISIDKDILTVSYDHKDESSEPQEGKWLRTEYRTRSFKRSFTLSEKIDAGKIAAKYADGVLAISLPKKEVAEPAVHEIAVN